MDKARLKENLRLKDINNVQRVRTITKSSQPFFKSARRRHDYLALKGHSLPLLRLRLYFLLQVTMVQKMKKMSLYS
ncbi:hypothetical protein ILYODFUR_018136 [Ilyodon furcidens]|uniref:Uncharacterized protein n=1 Tax=Ilyodon furcidens TaxID=33524 RepID=A0ABV0SM73_9TELE